MPHYRMLVTIDREMTVAQMTKFADFLEAHKDRIDKYVINRVETRFTQTNIVYHVRDEDG